MQVGKFITLEGIEGVGKSTASQFIQQQLSQAGISFIATREPGGTQLAEDLRKLLLSKTSEAPCELAELLLMFAARAQHLNQVIEPALAAGKWVVCDRFTDATFAYQGGGRGQSLEKLTSLEQLVHPNLQPDLTLLLDMPVEAAFERVEQRGEKDRFEQEHSDFFNRVRQAYLTRAQEFPARFSLINAGLTLNEVSQQLAAALTPLINSYKAK